MDRLLKNKVYNIKSQDSKVNQEKIPKKKTTTKGGKGSKEHTKEIFFHKEKTTVINYQGFRPSGTPTVQNQ